MQNLNYRIRRDVHHPDNRVYTDLIGCKDIDTLLVAHQLGEYFQKMAARTELEIVVAVNRSLKYEAIRRIKYEEYCTRNKEKLNVSEPINSKEKI